MYDRLDSSLKQIRVIVLEPGAREDHLRSTLRIVSLLDPASTHSYETISYAWGDPTANDLIHVHDEELKITASAAAALRRMRSSGTSRTLWIDAICINQADEVEKSSQVALMAEIFSLGAVNLIWLGLADADTDRAMTSVEAILSDLSRETDAFRNLRKTLYGSGGGARWQISRIPINFDEQAVSRLFASEWFRRRWVVQEATLSRTSLCFKGDFEIPLNDLLRTAMWINFHYLTFARLNDNRGVDAARTIHQFADRTYGWCATRENLTEVMDLHHILTMLKDFESSNPNDKVYGVLGLFRQLNSGNNAGDSLPITPDYTSSHGSLLTSIAIHSLTSGYSLEFLNDVQHLRRHVPLQTVSWAPRYDRYEPIPFLPYYVAANGCPEISPNHTICATNRLSCRGFRLGSITRRTGDMPYIWHDTAASASFLTQAIEIVQSTSIETAPKDVLGITLCAGRAYDANLADSSVMAESYSYFESRLLQHNELPPWPWEIDLDSTTLEGRSSQYKHETMSVLIYRCLFATDTAYIGIASEVLQPGDELALLCGCDWPVVLRKTGDGDDYEFIGTAYVHGIMFGEAMAMCVEEQRPLLSFNLV